MPRRASAAFTPFTSSRRRRTSITGADGSRATVDQVPAVTVSDLVVRYGDTVAVDHLSLTADAGHVLALLGPNGAGKTTTVETMEGYRSPAEGTVRILGLDPRADHRALTKRVGVMLQRGGVYPGMSALE